MDNPRQYISYSQLISWEKRKYYEEYILGNRRESKETLYGKRIAEGLHNGSKDEDIDFCRMWLPEPKEREKEITADIEGLKVKVVLDGFTKSPLIIDEYKTGKVPWTSSRALNSDQMTIYDLVVWYLFKKEPLRRIFWIPTKDVGDNGIIITGEIPQSFTTTRGFADRAKMLSRLKIAQAGINKLYKNL